MITRIYRRYSKMPLDVHRRCKTMYLIVCIIILNAKTTVRKCYGWIESRSLKYFKSNVILSAFLVKYSMNVPFIYLVGLCENILSIFLFSFMYITWSDIHCTLTKYFVLQFGLIYILQQSISPNIVFKSRIDSWYSNSRFRL